MTLYEIDQNIMSLLNEDGEITDPEAFDALQITRSEKLEGIACWIKNLNADIKAIKDEEERLKERRIHLVNKVSSLSGYLEHALNGEKFSTPRVAISYRTSSAVEITDNAAFVDWAKSYDPSLLHIKAEPNKTAIKNALNGGMEIPLAQIVERKSMQVK